MRVSRKSLTRPGLRESSCSGWERLCLMHHKNRLLFLVKAYPRCKRAAVVTIASSAAEKPLTHQEGDYAQNADQTRLSWCARQRTRTLLSEPTIYLIPECATGVEVDQVLREL